MRPDDSVTQAERVVLQYLWEVGVATIRDVRDELYPGGETSEYATVQKLLERLEAKGLVKRSRRSVPHTFAAKVERDTFVGRRLDDLAATYCDGSYDPIVSHLVRRAKLTDRERARLESLVDSLRRAAMPKRARE
ncbi:MAG: BlaI/MecI/CopY family transcriptional regulator [Planctomycetes bacterium]|nr:BlaI/MecI/CopY family transcriptional regulator [Planctomycetota bacterium]